MILAPKFSLIVSLSFSNKIFVFYSPYVSWHVCPFRMGSLWGQSYSHALCLIQDPTQHSMRKGKWPWP